MRSADRKVLMLGDSTVRHRSRKEEDKRQLFTLVAAQIDTELILVSHPARALDTFLAQVRYLDAARVKPALIIVPINLACFSPAWETRREYDFRRRNRMYLWPLTTRAMAVFKWPFESSAHLTRAETPVWIGGRKAGTLGSLLSGGAKDSADVGAARYRVRYATDVERSRQFAALEELAALGRKRHLNLLFYVTPINVQAMEKYAQPGDLAAVERGVGALWVRLAASGYRLSDLSSLASADEFDHPWWSPNEHLFAAGRQALADAVGSEARRLLH
ncbi:MAG: hypothetical protein ACE5GX_19790 [Thermoanaerobaculia bacterium]